MKAVIVLVLIGGGLLAWALIGGLSFDPAEQGQEAKAAITPGMTWAQVLDVAGDQPKYRHINLTKEKFGDEWVEVPKRGSFVDFSRSRLEQRIADQGIPEGFVFAYNFGKIQFEVVFDSTAKVVAVEDEMTVDDLFDPPGE